MKKLLLLFIFLGLFSSLAFAEKENFLDPISTLNIKFLQLQEELYEKAKAIHHMTKLTNMESLLVYRQFDFFGGEKQQDFYYEPVYIKLEYLPKLGSELRADILAMGTSGLSEDKKSAKVADNKRILTQVIFEIYKISFTEEMRKVLLELYGESYVKAFEDYVLLVNGDLEEVQNGVMTEEDRQKAMSDFRFNHLRLDFPMQLADLELIPGPEGSPQFSFNAAISNFRESSCFGQESHVKPRDVSHKVRELQKQTILRLYGELVEEILKKYFDSHSEKIVLEGEESPDGE